MLVVFFLLVVPILLGIEDARRGRVEVVLVEPEPERKRVIVL